MKKLIVLAAVVLLVGLLGSTPALAGGKGWGRGGSSASTAASLTVTPNPAAAGGLARASGTGYNNTTWVEVQVVGPDGQVVAAYATGVWADGHIDFTFSAPECTGSHTLKAYQSLSRDATLKAQTNMQVDP